MNIITKIKQCIGRWLYMESWKWKESTLVTLWGHRRTWRHGKGRNIQLHEVGTDLVRVGLKRWKNETRNRRKFDFQIINRSNYDIPFFSNIDNTKKEVSMRLITRIWSWVSLKTLQTNTQNVIQHYKMKRQRVEKLSEKHLSTIKIIKK